MRRCAAFALGLLFLAPTPAANAYLCFRTYQVVPAPLEAAPTNTHVWIYTDETDAAFCNDDGSVCEDTVRFELRTAPSGNDLGTKVAATERRMKTGQNDGGSGVIIELIPAAELAPRKRYEIWRSESRARWPDRMVGTVRTGASPDRKPPEWRGIREADPILPPGPRMLGARRVIVIDSGGSGIAVSAEPPRDAEGRVLYAAWRGDAGKPIDYTRPPDGYATPTSSEPGRDSFTLGWPGPCAQSTLAVPSNAKSIRIGIAATDLAGNRSATSERDVTLK